MIIVSKLVFMKCQTLNVNEKFGKFEKKKPSCQCTEYFRPKFIFLSWTGGRVTDPVTNDNKIFFSKWKQEASRLLSDMMQWMTGNKIQTTRNVKETF